jgi:hypothetical protein
MIKNTKEQKKKIPFLIIKTNDSEFPLNWRGGFNESEYFNILNQYTLDGNNALKKFQLRWKEYQTKKKKYDLCIQEINNDVAYRYGKYKMEFLKDRFYSNVQKLIY